MMNMHCLLHGHEVLIEQGRDPKKPSVMIWRCFRCLRVVGGSEYKPALRWKKLWRHRQQQRTLRLVQRQKPQRIA